MKTVEHGFRKREERIEKDWNERWPSLPDVLREYVEMNKTEYVLDIVHDGGKDKILFHFLDEIQLYVLLLL